MLIYMHICYRYDSKEGWGKGFIHATHVLGKSIEDATCVDRDEVKCTLSRSLTYWVVIEETARSPQNTLKHLVVERD